MLYKESSDEFQEFLRLLSRYNLRIPTRSSPGSIYRNLCDLLLSEEKFALWVSIDTSLGLDIMERNQINIEDY